MSKWTVGRDSSLKLCDSNCCWSTELISESRNTPWIQSLPQAAPGLSLKPLFQLNQWTLLTHGKTCPLAPDCYSISLVFSFIIAQTPHYMCRSRGKFTQRKTPLFWHKNSKALLSSKQRKSIVLAEMPTVWLLGRLAPGLLAPAAGAPLPGEGSVALREARNAHTHTRNRKCT